jgi:hypothetical protein
VWKNGWKLEVKSEIDGVRSGPGGEEAGRRGEGRGEVGERAVCKQKWALEGPGRDWGLPTFFWRERFEDDLLFSFVNFLLLLLTNSSFAICCYLFQDRQK